MKFLLPLIFLASVAAAQLPPANCRLIKGHLYDLASAEAAGPDSLYSNYWVRGEVTQVYPKCLIIRSIIGYGYFPDPARAEMNLRITGTDGLLKNAAARKLAASPDGVSAGQLLSMEPEMRNLFIQRPLYRHTIIFNYDYYVSMTNLHNHVPFSGVGVSCGTASLANGAGANLPAFDCGKPFGLPTTNYYRATPKGFILIGDGKTPPLAGH